MRHSLNRITENYSKEDIKLLHAQFVERVGKSGITDKELIEATRKARYDVRRANRSNSG